MPKVHPTSLPKYPEPASTRTVGWWPTESPEATQSDSGRILCSEEQQEVPIHWEVSRALAMLVDMQYTAGITSQQHPKAQALKNEDKVACGWSSNCLFRCAWSIYLIFLTVVLEGSFPSKSWQSINVLTFLFFHGWDTQRYWHTLRFCEVESPTS